MVDVAGGGTANVTLYDESGNTPAVLASRPLGSERGLAVRNVDPRTSGEHAARSGKAFVGGSGQVQVAALSTSTLRGLLINPAGSGRTIYLYELSVFSSAQLGYASMIVNPTGNLPTTRKNANNTFIGHPNLAVGQIYFDSGTAMTGGTDSGLVIPIPGNGVPHDYELEAPFVISPGVQLGFQGTVSGSTTVSVTAYWFEE